MQIQTSFLLNGLANGSPYSVQQPTLQFDNLPFGSWGSLSSARTVTGRVVGMNSSSGSQIGVFAVQSKGELMGNSGWTATVGSDGSFSVPVGQSAISFVGLLMTPDFASSYYSSTFPSGSGTVATLPTPTDDPGDVLLSVVVPAGLDRSLVTSGLDIPTLPPGTAWNMGTGIVRTLQPVNQNQPSPTSANYGQIWNFLCEPPSPFCLPFCFTAQTSSGSSTQGALAVGLYVYENDLYLIAGYGPSPRVQGSTITPDLVCASIVDWQVLPPSTVQVGITLTILSDQVMLSVDSVNVTPSVIQGFLKAYFKMDKALLGALFGML